MLYDWGSGAEAGDRKIDADGGQCGGPRREVAAFARVASLEMGWMWH